MTTLTESLHPGAFIIAEEERNHTRDGVQIALLQTLVSGQVLGRTALVAGITSASAADAGNTGNGVMTLDAVVPVAAGAKNGVYRVVNNLVAANGGEFEVFDPDGVEIGRVAVGATFNNQIKFVIADGVTDFAVGDAFSVTVGIERSDFDYLALDLAAATGAQDSAGILVGGIITDGVTKKKAAALVRGPAQVMGSLLTWPAGITAPQKAAEIAKLEKLGIIIR